jgi:hypothetical protein
MIIKTIKEMNPRNPAGIKFCVLTKRQINTISRIKDRVKAAGYPIGFFLKHKIAEIRRRVPKTLPEISEAGLPE